LNVSFAGDNVVAILCNPERERRSRMLGSDSAWRRVSRNWAIDTELVTAHCVY
jgi:hypothetical protein